MEPHAQISNYAWLFCIWYSLKISKQLNNSFSLRTLKRGVEGALNSIWRHLTIQRYADGFAAWSRGVPRMFFSCWCLPWFCCCLMFICNIPWGLLFLLSDLNHFDSLLLDLLQRKEGSTKQASHMGYAWLCIWNSSTPCHMCLFTEISAEASDAGFELTESTEMGGGYRVPCVHAMISLQNKFCLPVHWACKPNNILPTFSPLCLQLSYWAYFFLAARVGYSTRTFAARCSAFPDPFALNHRCSNCSKSWVMNVVSGKAHCTMRKKNGRRMISWSWHLASLGNWIDLLTCLVLLKLYAVSELRKTVDGKLTTDARLTCGWKFMTNLFESFRIYFFRSCQSRVNKRMQIEGSFGFIWYVMRMHFQMLCRPRRMKWSKRSLKRRLQACNSLLQTRHKKNWCLEFEVISIQANWRPKPLSVEKADSNTEFNMLLWFAAGNSPVENGPQLTHAVDLFSLLYFPVLFGSGINSEAMVGGKSLLPLAWSQT